MDNGIIKRINDRYDVLTKMISMSEKRIKNLPEGRISVKHHGKKDYYYLVRNNDKERLLKKTDNKLLKDLIQKSYLEKVIKAAEREKEYLSRIQKSYPDVLAEDVYENLKEDRKVYTKPVVLSDEQFIQRWQEREYDAKPISKDIPVFLTMKGEQVRSKSEMIIADRLYMNGVPYKYECPFLLGNNEIIHPDFTILRMSDRKIVYYEHCGRMDDPGYVEDMTGRAIKYSLAGIIQGDRLFYTFETSKTPLDVRVLDNLINSCFR